MLEVLAGLLLYMAIPDYVFGIIGIADTAIIMNIRDEVKQEKTLLAECEIFTKDYTDEIPEWFWGINEGKLDFQDLVGLTLSDVQGFIKGIEKTDKAKTKNYTLNVYFKKDHCVKIEYIRPLDRNFLHRYTDRTKGDLRFHVVNEFVPTIPVEFNCLYMDFLNIINDKNPQMFISATFCGNFLIDGITVKCHAKKKGDTDEYVFAYN